MTPQAFLEDIRVTHHHSLPLHPLCLFCILFCDHLINSQATWPKVRSLMYLWSFVFYRYLVPTFLPIYLPIVPTYLHVPFFLNYCYAIVLFISTHCPVVPFSYMYPLVLFLPIIISPSCMLPSMLQKVEV